MTLELDAHAQAAAQRVEVSALGLGLTASLSSSVLRQPRWSTGRRPRGAPFPALHGTTQRRTSPTVSLRKCSSPLVPKHAVDPPPPSSASSTPHVHRVVSPKSATAAASSEHVNTRFNVLMVPTVATEQVATAASRAGPIRRIIVSNGGASAGPAPGNSPVLGDLAARSTPHGQATVEGGGSSSTRRHGTALGLMQQRPCGRGKKRLIEPWGVVSGKLRGPATRGASRGGLAGALERRERAPTSPPEVPRPSPAPGHGAPPVGPLVLPGAPHTPSCLFLTPCREVTASRYAGDDAGSVDGMDRLDDGDDALATPVGAAAAPYQARRCALSPLTLHTHGGVEAHEAASPWREAEGAAVSRPFTVDLSVAVLLKDLAQAGPRPVEGGIPARGESSSAADPEDAARAGRHHEEEQLLRNQRRLEEEEAIGRMAIAFELAEAYAALRVALLASEPMGSQACSRENTTQCSCALSTARQLRRCDSPPHPLDSLSTKQPRWLDAASMVDSLAATSLTSPEVVRRVTRGRAALTPCRSRSESRDREGRPRSSIARHLADFPAKSLVHVPATILHELCEHNKWQERELQSINRLVQLIGPKFTELQLRIDAQDDGGTAHHRPGAVARPPSPSTKPLSPLEPR